MQRTPNTRTLGRSALVLGIAAATLVATVAPATARPADEQSAATTVRATSSVFSVTDALARQIATVMTDRAQRDKIVAATLDGSADLAALAEGSALASVVRDANQAVLAAKGLPTDSGSLLRLRLAQDDMRPALARGVTPLVAAAPTDDAVSAVIAYNPAGKQILLDAYRAPRQPVLVVEVDVERAMSIGVPMMRKELAKRGLTSTAGDVSADATTTGGYWATKVNAVYLSDDHEPWVKGGAEIFTIAGGFGHDGKARADIVTEPYLDNDGTVYYPGQLWIHFKNYKYNAADIVMMEDDGDVNYQNLVIAIIDALLYITDQGHYVPLVNPILQAIPNEWYTDDPDYVDSWYTLTTSTSGRLYGAARNGWIDVVPYWVSEL